MPTRAFRSRSMEYTIIPSGPAPATLRKYFLFAGSLSGEASPSGISRTTPRTSISAAKECQGHAMTIFLARQAVDDFVQRAIASTGDDQLATFVIRALGHLRGI